MALPERSATLSDWRAPRSEAPRFGRLLFGLLLILLIAYITGLILFVRSLPHRPGWLGDVDGVVVLTGGGSRLDTAGALFEHGTGRRLLITGVNAALPRARVKELVHGGRRFACCADIDRSAANTHGNAAEAAWWARRHGYHRLLLVTASYHMPRSLNEFHAAMPGMTLIPYPVDPDGVDLSGWYLHPGTIRLLQSEYDKYLGSMVLTHLLGEQTRDALDRSFVQNNAPPRSHGVARSSF